VYPVVADVDVMDQVQHVIMDMQILIQDHILPVQNLHGVALIYRMQDGEYSLINMVGSASKLITNRMNNHFILFVLNLLFKNKYKPSYFPFLPFN
jgi:hypothetical protein